MNLKPWQKNHKAVIENFLKTLNDKNHDYILKGGTSLMECYGLDRFSEDIDLDSFNKSYIKKAVDQFCKNNRYDYRIAKDTETVKRYIIHYDQNQTQDAKPLKIEISYRKRQFDPDEYTTINGIKVYTIEQIAILKEQAYMGRDKIRDLYDLVFICNNHWNDLSKPVKSMIQHGFERKGLEQFDYLIQSQKDELIDNDKLANDLLDVFEKLDIIVDETTNESDKRKQTNRELENLINDIENNDDETNMYDSYNK